MEAIVTGDDYTGDDRDQEWLADFFEFEVHAECGWDADKHRVVPDMFGKRHALCLDPIPDDMPDDQIGAELERRMAISTGPTDEGA